MSWPYDGVGATRKRLVTFSSFDGRKERCSSLVHGEPRRLSAPNPRAEVKSEEEVVDILVLSASLDFLCDARAEFSPLEVLCSLSVLCIISTSGGF